MVYGGEGIVSVGFFISNLDFQAKIRYFSENRYFITWDMPKNPGACFFRKEKAPAGGSLGGTKLIIWSKILGNVSPKIPESALIVFGRLYRHFQIFP